MEKKLGFIFQHKEFNQAFYLLHLLPLRHTLLLLFSTVLSDLFIKVIPIPIQYNTYHTQDQSHLLMILTYLLVSAKLSFVHCKLCQHNNLVFYLSVTDQGVLISMDFISSLASLAASCDHIPFRIYFCSKFE